MEETRAGQKVDQQASIKNTGYKTMAFLCSTIHVPVVAIILFGWLFAGLLSYLYLLVLVATLLSWVVLGYCPLSKWEYDFRKKFSEVPRYRYEYLHYWGYRLTRIDIDPIRIRILGTLFLIGSIIVWFVLHFPASILR